MYVKWVNPTNCLLGFQFIFFLYAALSRTLNYTYGHEKSILNLIQINNYNYLLYTYNIIITLTEHLYYMLHPNLFHSNWAYMNLLCLPQTLRPSFRCSYFKSWSPSSSMLDIHRIATKEEGVFETLVSIISSPCQTSDYIMAKADLKLKTFPKNL